MLIDHSILTYHQHLRPSPAPPRSRLGPVGERIKGVSWSDCGRVRPFITAMLVSNSFHTPCIFVIPQAPPQQWAVVPTTPSPRCAGPRSPSDIQGHPLLAKSVYDARPSVRCPAIDICVDPSWIHGSCPKPAYPAVIARSLLALQSERAVRISAIPL